MSYQTPRTWGNEQITAALFQTHVSDNLNVFRHGNDYGVKVYLTSSQNIADSTNTKVSWGAIAFEWHDASVMWSVANPTRLVAPIAGKYLVLVNLEWRSDVNNLRNLSLVRNSPAQQFDLQSQGSVGGKSNLSGMCVVDLNASAYLEVQVFQASGHAGGLTLHGGTVDRTRAAMILLGV